MFHSDDENDDSNTSYQKADISISDALADFGKLRISALTKAAAMSPSVRQVTIGPNSPIKKESFTEDPTIIIKSSDTYQVENPNEDIIGEDLRYFLIKKRMEAKLRESSDLKFKTLIEKMVQKRADTMKRFWTKQSEECDKKAQDLRARKYRLLKELQDNDNLSVSEKAKLDDENNKLINTQTINIMNKILEEQNQATARFASVTDSHTKICINYNEINNLLETEEHAKQICDKHVDTLNSIIDSVNLILDHCRAGTITDNDVKQAGVLAQNIENIRHTINQDLSLIKQKEIDIKKAKQKEQEDKLKLEKAKTEELEIQAKAKELDKQAIAVVGTKEKPLFYSKTNYTHYKELKKNLSKYESQCKELHDNTNFKKFRFDCQKAVNTPVNAISSVSGMHIKDKYEKLSKLLRGERVQVLDTFIQATQHPQGLAYVTALLARKIVRQGDSLVSSNHEAAFTLASVAVALCSQFPEFSKLLEANFHKECPYLVPMFLPQKQGQTDKEFYISRGYSYSAEGVVEKQDKFLKRMSGVFRLKCAMWIAKTPRFLNTPNPHGLQYAWTWVASFINLKPEPDICATLLLDFFSVCGSEMFKYYGVQFNKIIKLICTDYMQILEHIDEGGPKTRLEVFLLNVLKTGSIPPPDGQLPPNTW